MSTLNVYKIKKISENQMLVYFTVKKSFKFLFWEIGKTYDYYSHFYGVLNQIACVNINTLEDAPADHQKLIENHFWVLEFKKVISQNLNKNNVVKLEVINGGK